MARVVKCRTCGEWFALDTAHECDPTAPVREIVERDYEDRLTDYDRFWLKKHGFVADDE